MPNLKGDEARSTFVNLFKEVQRLKTQLDQYTDLTGENKATIEQILPKEELQAFKGVYLDTALRLKKKQDKEAKGRVGRMKNWCSSLISNSFSLPPR